MKYNSVETVEQAIQDLPHRSGLYTEELQAISDYCIKNGCTKESVHKVIFWIALAAEAVGFQKGRTYQKNKRHKKSLAHATNDKPVTE